MQVVVVDHDSDEELVRVDQKAAEAIDLHCDQGPVACIQVRGLSSAAHVRLPQLGKICMALSWRWVCGRSGMLC